MTKAYLAGFIAGTQGKTWEESPYHDEYCRSAIEWRQGHRDGESVICGCEYTGKEEVQ